MTINIDELIAKVRQIAAERPDVTYDAEKCYYDRGECSDGSVGCIFGQAGIEAHDFPDGGVEGIYSILCMDCDEIKARWCEAVQEQQDLGASWSEAVGFADEKYPLEMQ